MTKGTKNDLAWAKILSGMDLGSTPVKSPLHLSMDELRKLGQREPRLLMSMDNRRKWPAPLRALGIFPLSLSSTRLALLPGEGWFDLPKLRTEKTSFRARLPFELASSTIGQGENAHIMRLDMSGVLCDFLGAKQILSVASGKRMTPKFSFHVGGHEVQAEGAQYEMDAQYESLHDIIPIEMKPMQYDSCSIRQVYYPFRSLGEDTFWKKPIRPLFISYMPKDDSYGLRELGFRDRSDWDSIHQIESREIQVVLEAPPRRLLDLDSEEILDYRIPQANDVGKIAEFPLLVARGITTAVLMTQHTGLDIRQSNYYRDAAQSLGLLHSIGGEYCLLPPGKRYVNLSSQHRADFLATRMAKLPVLRAVLVAMERQGELGLEGRVIPELLQKFALERGQPLNSVTAARRASTIRAYLRYIGSRTGTIISMGDRFYLRDDVPSLDDFST